MIMLCIEKNRILLGMIVITLFFSRIMYSQQIFPEQYEGCNTDRFALESDSITAKVSDTVLVETIVKEFDKKIRKKILGGLALQILVDMEGNSCLLSVENGTQFYSDKLGIKEIIDNYLKWEKPIKKISALVDLKFYTDSTVVTRTGINGNTGIHTLKKTVLKRDF